MINASLWDIMSTGLSHYSEHIVETHIEDLLKAFYPLMEDEKFIKSITYATNNTERVIDRFKIAKSMFEEVFNADKN